MFWRFEILKPAIFGDNSLLCIYSVDVYEMHARELVWYVAYDKIPHQLGKSHKVEYFQFELTAMYIYIYIL